MCEPQGKHDADRSAVRHGAGGRSVTQGERRVPVTPPEMHAVDGPAGLPMASYQVSSTQVLRLKATEQMLAGLSKHRYQVGLEPIGQKVWRVTRSTSKSAVSRRFVAAIETALAELLSRAPEEQAEFDRRLTSHRRVAEEVKRRRAKQYPECRHAEGHKMNCSHPRVGNR